MSYKYFIYGILVSTSFPFKQLKQSNTTHHEDVVVDLDTSLDVPSESLNYEHWYHTSSSHIAYSRKGVAFFVIENGIELRCKPYPGVDYQEVARVLLGIPMGYLLQQRGMHVLHASVVNIDGQAAAFNGLSGSGKSTMAASFLQNNHSLLTEDTAAIDLSTMMVVPAFPSLKIAQDALEQLDLPPRELINAPTDSRNRFIYPMDDKQFYGQPAKLKNCYLLEWGEQLSIEPVEVKQAFFQLFPHTFRPITGVDSEELDTESFKKMTDFANKVSVYKLTRPKSFASLDDCRLLVEEHMQQREPR